MIFEYIQSDIEVADKDFDSIYPKKIKEAADIHFSPIKVSKVAAFYLADKKDTKILDIGSGAGKFCLIGSACTDAYFIGVEQRKSLCKVATQIAKQYHLKKG